jgi:deazaflavin-dependent oxidoreductase (nitroreductase family)
MIMPVMDATSVSRDDGWTKSAADPYCYVTTTGRRSGRPHTVEIWFGLDGHRLYLLSGGGDRSDWVRNLVVHPEVTVRLGDRSFPGRARLVSDPSEDDLARRLLAGKYQGWTEGETMSRWARTAVAVVIELVPSPDPGR